MALTSLEQKISLYHAFSKTPVASDAALSQTANISGHTVTKDTVRTSDIQWGTNDITVTPEVGTFCVYKETIYIPLADPGTESIGWASVGDVKTSGQSFGNTTHLYKSLYPLTESNNNNANSVINGKSIAWRAFEDDTCTTVYSPFICPTDVTKDGKQAFGYKPILYVGGVQQNESTYSVDYYGGLILFNDAISKDSEVYLSFFVYTGDYLKNTIENLQSEDSSLDTKISSVRSGLETTNSTLATTNTTLANVKSGLETVTGTTIPKLSGDITSNATDISNIKKTIGSNFSTEKTISAAVDTINSNVSTNTSGISNLQEQIGSGFSKSNQISSNISDIKTTIGSNFSTSKSISSIIGDVSSYSSTNTIVKKIESLSSSYTTLNNTLYNAKTGDIVTIKSTIGDGFGTTSLTQKITDINTTVSGNSSSISTINSVIGDTSSYTSTIMADLTAIKGEIGTSFSSSKSISTVIGDISSYTSNIIADLTTLSNRIGSSFTTSSSASSQFNTLKGIIGDTSSYSSTNTIVKDIASIKSTANDAINTFYNSATSKNADSITLSQNGLQIVLSKVTGENSKKVISPSLTITPATYDETLQQISSTSIENKSLVTADIVQETVDKAHRIFRNTVDNNDQYRVGDYEKTRESTQTRDIYECVLPIEGKNWLGKIESFTIKNTAATTFPNTVELYSSKIDDDEEKTLFATATKKTSTSTEATYELDTSTDDIIKYDTSLTLKVPTDDTVSDHFTLVTKKVEEEEGVNYTRLYVTYTTSGRKEYVRETIDITLFFDELYGFVKEDTFLNHAQDEDIHVTASEKSSWNDALYAWNEGVKASTFTDDDIEVDSKGNPVNPVGPSGRDAKAGAWGLYTILDSTYTRQGNLTSIEFTTRRDWYGKDFFLLIGEIDKSKVDAYATLSSFENPVATSNQYSSEAIIKGSKTLGYIRKGSKLRFTFGNEVSEETPVEDQGISLSKKPIWIYACYKTDSITSAADEFDAFNNRMKSTYSNSLTEILQSEYSMGDSSSNEWCKKGGAFDNGWEGCTFTESGYYKTSEKQATISALYRCLPLFVWSQDRSDIDRVSKIDCDFVIDVREKWSGVAEMTLTYNTNDLDIDQVSDKVENIENRVITLENKTVELDNEISDITGSGSSSGVSLTTLNKRLTTAESNITTLNTNLTSAKSDISTNTSNITSNAKDIAVLSQYANSVEASHSTKTYVTTLTLPSTDYMTSKVFVYDKGNTLNTFDDENDTVVFESVESKYYSVYDCRENILILNGMNLTEDRTLTVSLKTTGQTVSVYIPKGGCSKLNTIFIDGNDTTDPSFASYSTTFGATE